MLAVVRQCAGICGEKLVNLDSNNAIKNTLLIKNAAGSPGSIKRSGVMTKARQITYKIEQSVMIISAAIDRVFALTDLGIRLHDIENSTTLKPAEAIEKIRQEVNRYASESTTGQRPFFCNQNARSVSCNWHDEFDTCKQPKSRTPDRFGLARNIDRACTNALEQVSAT